MDVKIVAAGTTATAADVIVMGVDAVIVIVADVAISAVCPVDLLRRPRFTAWTTLPLTMKPQRLMALHRSQLCCRASRSPSTVPVVSRLYPSHPQLLQREHPRPLNRTSSSRKWPAMSFPMVGMVVQRCPASRSRVIAGLNRAMSRVRNLRTRLFYRQEFRLRMKPKLL